MTDENAPTADPIWTELLEDAGSIAETYRDAGWDVVVLEPVDVSSSERADRFGLEAVVSDAEYDLLETLIEDEDVTFADAEVYYRPADGDDRRFALAVERDEASTTAVCVPLTYSISRSREVFRTALSEEELLVHVRAVRSDGDDDTDDDTGSRTEGEQDVDFDRWVTFSHDDPSLFLEESDVQA
ncbi:DUF7529 family protein [Natrarchaeobius chitinivorans]|uniref:Uncharacterized protein n=1 Tax=Natrarchaeobius chitinivorans TaxID=1679083 RepID=A0A3N6M8T9_NATCH|nr:hypothetical protein [Natrarchaeobius chitinivorans]RQG91801.1 hypothetical protein EA473_18560 [Natrarchaeobius chitinivorans]